MHEEVSSKTTVRTATAYLKSATSFAGSLVGFEADSEGALGVGTGNVHSPMGKRKHRRLPWGSAWRIWGYVSTFCFSVRISAPPWCLMMQSLKGYSPRSMWRVQLGNFVGGGANGLIFPVLPIVCFDAVCVCMFQYKQMNLICTCGSSVAKWKCEVGAHLGLSCALQCLCACLLSCLHAR